jgi:4-hydroxy-tetrahydrodipicolinate reductase
MTATTPIAVAGVSGRMGRILVDTVLASEVAALVAATEAPGHPWIGRDLGACLGRAGLGVTVGDDPLDAVARARALIDFTAPGPSVAHAALAAQARIVHVIGTTGIDEAGWSRLRAAARHAVIVQAGNMSLGVNLLVAVTRRVAAALGPDYDIEIVEAHHRHKADAPSGTALMLGAAAAEGRGLTLDAVAERGRDGPRAGPRGPSAIGFASVRGGDIVGEHDVIFAGPGERVVLRHIAHDRALFARGALRAALWGQGHPPGLYSMADVLGLG